MQEGRYSLEQSLALDYLTISGLILFGIVGQGVNGLPLQIDPRENMWVTWAHATGQTDFCLSLAQAQDPFRTCLIGYPFLDWNDWGNYTSVSENMVQQAWDKWKSSKTSHLTCARKNNFPIVESAFMLAQILGNLTVNATLPLQELDLMGSFSPYGPLVNLSTEFNCIGEKHFLHASNGTGAVLFNVHKAFDDNDFWRLKQRVSPDRKGAWENASPVIGTSEVTTRGGYFFPKGYFLICGDRAWSGVPRNAWGGPCYIGKLTMMTANYRNLLVARKHRKQRSITNIGPDCNPKVAISSLAEAVAMAFFTPRLLAAENWRNIKRLACFAIKEFNVTSNILDDLLHDVDSIRHAVLQNRAATDFLLLAQGHGCNEFEGMCCLNLSDHSNSIHNQLQTLRGNFKDITIKTSWLDRWLTSLGITGWLLDLVKHGIVIVLVILVIIVFLPCLLQMIQRQVSNLVNKMSMSFVVVKKEGGNVESLEKDWLRSRGHEPSDEVRLIKLSDEGMRGNKTKVSWR